ncbi:glycosyltransferase family protein [Flavobacterium collinsii]|nr:glycosyltransferase [Flavobacterium collinsii]
MKHKPSLLMYCHHSVGIGHLVRSIAIIESLREDYDISFISGGKYPEGIQIPSGISFHQLPAVRLTEDTTLIDADGNNDIGNIMAERTRIIKQIYNDTLPDIIITELFPFGRMQFVGEIMPILKLAKSGDKKTLVFCSFRDIVEPSTAKKKLFRDFAFSILNNHYDGIFLHADAQICKLEDTIDYIGKIDVPVHYTGFVTSMQKIKTAQKVRNGVLASFGGGGTNNQLLYNLISAYKDFGFGDKKQLKIIAGPLFNDEEFKSLQDSTASIPGLTLIKQVSNLNEEIAAAEVSISQCGYNTAIELLCNGIPALLIPYENDHNSEQVIRAEQLEKRSLARTLSVGNASPEILAAEIKKTFNFRPKTIDIDMNGAENTRTLLNHIFAAETVIKTF